MIFYKYTPINNFTLYNLSTNSLYCAKQEKLNDPFDSSIVAKFDHFTHEELVEYLRQKKGDYKTLHDYIIKFPDGDEKVRDLVPYLFAQELLDGIRICSFSKDYNNPLMWAHYSNNYKGICIGYKAEVEKENTYQILSDDNIKYKIKKVIYQRSTGKTVVKPNMKRSIPNEKLLLLKNNAWKYENEYRIITKNEKTSNIFLKENTITEIIFGSKCDIIEHNIVKSLANKYNKNIAFYKIKIGETGIEKEKIT